MVSFQSAMARNMHGDSAALAPYLNDQSHSARARVYQNNMLTALSDVLGDNFPVVKKLVGDEFMTALARAYVEVEPPKSPLMTKYGQSFPEFIDGFPPTQSLPYLGDVARLDWAFIEALFASNEAPLDPIALSGATDTEVAGLSPGLHPSVRIVRSKWNAFDIWAGNKLDVTRAGIELVEKQSAAIVWRGREGITYRPLALSVASILEAVAGGSSLGSAVPKDNTAEVMRFLTEALALGIFGAIHQARE